MLAPIHLTSVGSTNDWVREQGRHLADGQWVVADRQTAGRGRMGRAWTTPAGNFAGSCRIVPQPAEAPAHLFSLVAALALDDLCATIVPTSRLQIKWPNDLLLDGGKLSGILLERDESGLVLGIGVNLRQAPDVAGRHTMALADVAEAVPAPLAFAGHLGQALAARRRQWRDEGFDAIRRDWLARAHAPGSLLSVAVDGTFREGRFLGLADDGALRILVDGAEQRLHAADVLHAAEKRPRKEQEAIDAARH